MSERGDYVLALIVGAAAALIAIMLPLPRPGKVAAAVLIAVGASMLVFGVAAYQPPPADFVPGTGVHTIEPPGPSGGVR